MKYIKKILSLVLAVVMIFTMCPDVAAAEADATISMSVDKTSVAVDEIVTVTISIDNEFTNMTIGTMNLNVNTDVFEYVSAEAVSPYEISNNLETNKSVKVVCVDINGTSTFSAGTIATVKLKAKAEATAASFSLTDIDFAYFDEGYNDLYKVVNAPAPVSVTVTEKAPEPSKPVNGYAVYGGTDVSASTADEIIVKLYVTHSDTKNVTTYNAYDVTVKYNAEELEFVSYTAPEGDESHANYKNTVDGTVGTIQFAGFGEYKEFSNAVGTLKFKVLIAGGEAAINIESPKISDQAAAIEETAPEVEIAGGSDNTADEIIVNVAYSVTKPEFVVGEDKAAPGADYTFSFTDTKNYTYSDLEVTVGGTEVVPSEVNGIYTITNVTGEIVITATQTAKSYSVTFVPVETVTYEGEETATYDTDYTVKVTTSKEGYEIGTVKATINGETVTLVSGENNTYTLAGNKITGNISIEATVVEAGTHTLVKFEGNGAEDVVGGTEQTAEIGKEFTFKMKDSEDEIEWLYTVMLGNEELIPNNAGEYSIPADSVTAEGVTVTVTKEQVTEADVNVTTYISLDEKTMYLVTATRGENVLAYNDEQMFWSDKYEAYCWLVISEEALSEETAKAAISAVEDTTVTATEIAYDMDINQSTGEADINDAQLTYDMYTAKYDSFETVAMDKFLEADVNGDYSVNVLDAAAIVNYILGITE